MSNLSPEQMREQILARIPVHHGRLYDDGVRDPISVTEWVTLVEVCALVDRMVELQAKPSPPPTNEYAAPIAKIVVESGQVAIAELYAPGLPDGEHNLFVEANHVHWDRQYAPPKGEYVLVSDMVDHFSPQYGAGLFCTPDAIKSRQLPETGDDQ